MQLTGEHVLGVPRERVWEALQDPAVLQRTLPGAQSVQMTEPDSFAVAVAIGIGAVKGSYQGTFRLTDKQAPERCQIRASASGTPGSVEVVARLTLDEGQDHATTLRYEADAAVVGPVANVGQRLIASAARKTTSQFLAALADDLTSPAPPAVPADGLPSREAEAAGAAPAASVDPSRPARSLAPATHDPVLVGAAGVAAGFALGLVGVLVGRWTGRRP